MSEPAFLDPRATERRDPRTADLDTADAATIVDLLNAGDRGVADAVAAARDAIARTIDRAAAAIAEGGRLVYVGAGTSGRLGALDAAECPPTFGVAPDVVRAVIAGGPEALLRAVEGAEDDGPAGAAAMAAREVGPRDVVVGIAASGATPYVLAALAEARRRAAATALVCCAEPPADVAADETILVRVGPEAIAGSTRLRAGTATKLVLNTLSTGAMIRTGRVYGNLMVGLTATSEKLRGRAERIVMEAGGVGRDEARRCLREAGGRAKSAVVMARLGVSADEAARRLEAAGGRVRDVAGDPPPVTS